MTTYRMVQKSEHPRNSMDVRFFGPPCTVRPPVVGN